MVDDAADIGQMIGHVEAYGEHLKQLRMDVAARVSATAQNSPGGGAATSPGMQSQISQVSTGQAATVRSILPVR
jgi:hypothetical protein